MLNMWIKEIKDKVPEKEWGEVERLLGDVGEKEIKEILDDPYRLRFWLAALLENKRNRALRG